MNEPSDSGMHASGAWRGRPLTLPVVVSTRLGTSAWPSSSRPPDALCSARSRGGTIRGPILANQAAPEIRWNSGPIARWSAVGRPASVMCCSVQTGIGDRGSGVTGERRLHVTEDTHDNKLALGEIDAKSGAVGLATVRSRLPEEALF